MRPATFNRLITCPRLPSLRARASAPEHDRATDAEVKRPLQGFMRSEDASSMLASSVCEQSRFTVCHQRAAAQQNSVRHLDVTHYSPPKHAAYSLSNRCMLAVDLEIATIGFATAKTPLQFLAPKGDL